MTLPIAALTCPKCGGQMRNYERNGVMVDQCTDCRGIFLDRGELERLIEAEGIHYGESVQPEQRAMTDAGRRGSYDDDGDSERDPRASSDPGRGAGHGGKQKRRGGFLGDLLDF